MGRKDIRIKELDYKIMEAEKSYCSYFLQAGMPGRPVV